MIALWFILRILLFVTAAAMIVSLLKYARHKGSLAVLLNGIKSGLKNWGLTSSAACYPVELYKWVAMDDEEVCEECLERASWPPMDIADWMKAGLPRTPEADTECGRNCRCQLMLYESRIPHRENKPH